MVSPVPPSLFAFFDFMFFFSLYPLCSFSLFRQRKSNQKRELVARFESEQITILKNCAAGLATLKQVLALPPASFFNHRICYLPLSLSQPIFSKRVDKLLACILVGVGFIPTRKRRAHIKYAPTS